MKCHLKHKGDGFRHLRRSRSHKDEEGKARKGTVEMDLRRGRKSAGVAIIMLFLLLAATAYAEETTCIYCGMKKSEYGHSWMIVRYNDGSVGEFCSLHCACIDMVLHTEKTATTVMVGDYASQKLINADNAFWIVGGSKIGVMTTRAKWAFESKKAADRYMSQYGGTPATFQEAIEAALEDMVKDMMMIQTKRKLMRKRRMEENGSRQPGLPKKGQGDG